MAEAVNETRRRIGPLEARRLRIDIAPEVRRARIAGDRVALREMLRNLVDNALRYAPDGPVDIQATPVAGYRVALTVSDRGPGIADDEKEAVQQRFTRGRAGESCRARAWAWRSCVPWPSPTAARCGCRTVPAAA